jgi:hypothetical protein
VHEGAGTEKTDEGSDEKGQRFDVRELTELDSQWLRLVEAMPARYGRSRSSHHVLGTIFGLHVDALQPVDRKQRSVGELHFVPEIREDRPADDTQPDVTVHALRGDIVADLDVERAHRIRSEHDFIVGSRCAAADDLEPELSLHRPDAERFHRAIADDDVDARQLGCCVDVGVRIEHGLCRTLAQCRIACRVPCPAVTGGCRQDPIEAARPRCRQGARR